MRLAQYPKGLLPGDAVAVEVVGGPVAQVLRTHFGVVSRVDARGRVWVVSSSRRTGACVEERLGDFAQGGDVVRADLPRLRPADEVVRRARALLGRPWDLLEANGEHVVRHALGLGWRSLQVERLGGRLAHGARPVVAPGPAPTPRPLARRRG